MSDPKIFDTLLEPTFIIDADNKVHYCNEPAALICDMSVRKIMRSNPVFNDLFRFADEIEALKSTASIQDPSPYQEVSFEMESGKSGRVQLTVQPYFEPNRWIVFFRDVTLEETLQRKYRAELEKKESVITALEEAQKKLEDYSRNLENMVAERTAQLTQINSQMKALLDSLHQGFLIFDSQGLCLDIASKACSEVFETNPRGQNITDVFKMSPNAAASFKKWMATAFAEMLPFEDLTPLAPAEFAHSQGKHITLEYYPIRNDGGQIEGIVAVGTDITALIEAQRQAGNDKAYAQMIIQLVQNRRQVLGFIRESESLMHEIRNQFAQTPNYEVSFRALHTFKGGAASFSIQSLVEELHHTEEALGEWQEHPDEEHLNKLRSQADRIESSFNSFLSGTENILGSRTAAMEARREVPVYMLREFYLKLSDRKDLRDLFMRQFLMEKVQDVLGHYNDTLQTTANSLGKIVAPLNIEDPEFMFYPEPYQRLLSTLVHAFRNSVDHGIESPDRRAESSKPSAGQVGLRVSRPESLLMRIEIWDDGGGIDPEKIRARLQKKGYDATRESDADVIQHVFDSEFSTRDQVTDLSGRGVGMDAIMAAARELGGTAWVESKLNEGSRFIIEVPWLESLDFDRRQSA